MEDGYIKRKVLTPEQAYVKIRHYCAFQERTHQEVKTKLAGYGISWYQASELLSKLIEDGFLNEERFAKAFAGGKFRIKGWGRKKIEAELKKRYIADYSIRKAIREEIGQEDYEKMAMKLIEKKWTSLTSPGDTAFVKQSKTRQYLFMRGYENDVITRVMKLFLCKD
jgi:regulatory protein